mgnify:CR=1 FL=1
MAQTFVRKKFKYGRSFKIINWGVQFDSLLELKYAISIQDEYAFLRSRIAIYYHHGAGQPTSYIREGVRRYTPDYLIRHKQTGEAFLVEIKPRAAENDPQLALRREVAEKYIHWRRFDWKFKIVFDDEIVLNRTGLSVFQDCCKLKSNSAFKIWLAQQDKRYNRYAPTYFAKPPRECDIRFVMLGMHSPGCNYI